MANDQRAVVTCQRIGVAVQIVLGGIVDRDALGFAPKRKGALERGPARRGVFLGNAAGAGIVHMRIARPAEQGRGMRDARRALGPAHKAFGPRPVQADMRSEIGARGASDALVVVRPTPIIIGAPCAGAEHHHDAGGRLACAQHKHRLRGMAIDAERNAIDPVAPVGRDLQRKGLGPVAALFRAILGRGGKAGVDLAIHHHLRVKPIARDHQMCLIARGADMQPQCVARRIGQRIAIAPDLRAGRVVAGGLIIMAGNRRAVIIGARGEKPR